MRQTVADFVSARPWANALALGRELGEQNGAARQDVFGGELGDS